MVMRYYGGGIGHLNNTPLQQTHGSDPLDPNSDEMAVDEDDDCHTESGMRDGLQDNVMNGGELEVDGEGRGGEDDSDEDDYDSCDYDEMDEGLGGDEDEDEEGGSDDDEDYGYASA
jgi:hypothetical protein